MNDEDLSPAVKAWKKKNLAQNLTDIVVKSDGKMYYGTGQFMGKELVSDEKFYDPSQAFHAIQRLAKTMETKLEMDGFIW
jgi:hypothetical protein